MLSAVDQVIQAIGVGDDVVQLLRHAVLVQGQALGQARIGLGQSGHPAIGGRTGGGRGKDTLTIRPRVENIEVLFGLNCPHGIPRCPGVLVVFLDDMPPTLPLLALDQRQE